MTMIDAEERAAIRESFARLLAERCSEADLRRTMATDSGHDADLWRAMAAMGLPALLIDPAHGGIGAGPVELEAIMEEAGAALLAGPFLSTAVLAAGLIGEAGDAATKARLLPGLAAGDTLAAVALTSDTGTWTPEGVGITARRDGSGWVLDGTASFVLSANVADLLLVIARTDEGLGCFEVAPTAAGLALTPLDSWDRTLRLSRLVFANTPAVPLAGVDAAAIERVLDLARVALAGEQAGATRRVFDLTVDYLKTRVQFGRPIGGFQAIKHIAADLLIDVESATSAARAAAQALASDAPDRGVLVNLAAFACADAFGTVAAQAIQLHGGIAFTWEHAAHLYLRRARADAQLFGSSDLFRERYLTALEHAA